ncbi:hypothetical protein [Pseudoclavibacter helvolus]|uniref:hypothetical protein n=1 Tax=Pseudoclavibacter helvolus TaxID=255205 RepID=UPI003C74525A
MSKDTSVPRPTKKGEYRIRFATNSARKGWVDLAATIRNPLADAWDFLTSTPQVTTPNNYRLRDELGTLQRDGRVYARWQHKPTLRGDARIWFYVDGDVVYLEQVHTHHPNVTK